MTADSGDRMTELSAAIQSHLRSLPPDPAVLDAYAMLLRGWAAKAEHLAVKAATA